MKKIKFPSIRVEIPLKNICFENLTKIPLKFGMVIYEDIPIIGVAIGGWTTLMPINPSQCKKFYDHEIRAILEGDTRAPIIIIIAVVDEEGGETICIRRSYLSLRCSIALVGAMYEYHNNLIANGPISDNINPCYLEAVEWEGFSENSLVQCDIRDNDQEKYHETICNPYLYEYSFFPE